MSFVTRFRTRLVRGRRSSGFPLVISALALAAASGPACNSTPDDGQGGNGGKGGGGPVESMFVVPSSLDALADDTFFNQPFPSDLRLENGKVRFKGFPNPAGVLIFGGYIDYIDGKLDGFSPVAAGFVRFTGTLDPASLPADPGASIKDDSTVSLIDVTSGSPDFGKRMPITVTFHDVAGIYWPAHTLAYMPAVGYPLRPHTTYALVVTDGVKTPTGAAVQASSDLSEVVGNTTADDAHKAAHDAFAAPIKTVQSVGVDVKKIVHFSSFTTNDPTEEYFAAAKAMPKQIDAPTADPAQWAVKAKTANFTEYVGSYGPSPNYQAGSIPYTNFGDGGNFKDDADGVPEVQNKFNLRFSLSVPVQASCPIPDNGYPIALYAHGTGGDYRSYVDDGTALSLTTKCIAVMGVDQIFHGTRPGAPTGTADQVETEEEILFFNFNNIEAARTNVRQSGLDEIQRARLFTETHLQVPAATSITAQAITFDSTKLLFFGHSQGSLNGPLFLAASEEERGGVLSGASGLISITLLDKTSPQPSVAGLVKTVFLGLNDSTGAELEIDHPAISFVQSIIDPVDPINYTRYITLEPHVGGPKSIYQTEGIRADGTGDTYAPPRGGEALALSLGLQLQQPFVRKPPDSVWGGLNPVSVPSGGLSGNLDGGKATGILAQFDPGSGEGHFVVFDVPAATKQSAGFMKNLAANPVGEVPPL